jgi:hypothetical protein
VSGGPGDGPVVLRGTVRVAAEPAAAWRLFTPEGERGWAAGWAPRYPVPENGDGSAVGTVFETGGDGHHPAGTWIVTGREVGRSVAYARVVAGLNAGTVTVTVAADGNGGSEATVAYALTALTPAGRDHLTRFATNYQPYLHSWQEAIEQVTG